MTTTFCAVLILLAAVCEATLMRHPWTRKHTGCQCRYNHSRFDCACCVDGACQCGVLGRHLCARCGHISPITCSLGDSFMDALSDTRPNGWTGNMTCPCPDDPSQSTCACCENDGCRCWNNPYLCAQCGREDDCPAEVVVSRTHSDREADEESRSGTDDPYSQMLSVDNGAYEREGYLTHGAGVWRRHPDGAIKQDHETSDPASRGDGQGQRFDTPHEDGYDYTDVYYQGGEKGENGGFYPENENEEFGATSPCTPDNDGLDTTTSYPPTFWWTNPEGQKCVCMGRSASERTSTPTFNTPSTTVSTTSSSTTKSTSPTPSTTPAPTTPTTSTVATTTTRGWMRVNFDCSTLYQHGVYDRAGVHTIRPGSLQSSEAYCSDGWTAIQARRDDSVSFERTWEEYKNGFGDVRAGNYWLGLERIHQMTTFRRYKLKIVMHSFKRLSYWIEYDHFWIENEANGYRLHIEGQSHGNAGDSLRFRGFRGRRRHDGMKFSTVDRDNDWSSISCASTYRSGWWFRNCYAANLNGQYINPRKGGLYAFCSRNGCVSWMTFHRRLSLKSTVMMIRPVDFTSPDGRPDIDRSVPSQKTEATPTRVATEGPSVSEEDVTGEYYYNYDSEQKPESRRGTHMATTNRVTTEDPPGSTGEDAYNYSYEYDDEQVEMSRRQH